MLRGGIKDLSSCFICITMPYVACPLCPKPASKVCIYKGLGCTTSWSVNKCTIDYRAPPLEKLPVIEAQVKRAAALPRAVATRRPREPLHFKFIFVSKLSKDQPLTTTGDAEALRAQSRNLFTKNLMRICLPHASW